MAPERGNRLKELREARFSGPTLDSRRKVAGMMGVSERTIYRWETADTPIPPKHWALLSAIFGVSPAYLLGIDDNGEGDGPGLRAVA